MWTLQGTRSLLPLFSIIHYDINQYNCVCMGVCITRKTNCSLYFHIQIKVCILLDFMYISYTLKLLILLLQGIKTLTKAGAALVPLDYIYFYTLPCTQQYSHMGSDLQYTKDREEKQPIFKSGHERQSNMQMPQKRRGQADKPVELLDHNIRREIWENNRDNKVKAVSNRECYLLQEKGLSWSECLGFALM